jgi:hypothetical protein
VPGVREYTVVRHEPLVEKVCPVCGRTFEGLSRRIYCSSSCLYRADYKRHADHRRAAQRERNRRRRGRRAEEGMGHGSD